MQDIYDLINEFNANLQDVSTTVALKLEKELLLIFSENEVTKLRPTFEILKKLFDRDPHKNMSEEMGGKIGKLVHDTKNMYFKCSNCFEMHRCNKLKGYIHDDGYEDSRGNKWWIYISCEKNPSRAFSYWKIRDKLVDNP